MIRKVILALAFSLAAIAASAQTPAPTGPERFAKEIDAFAKADAASMPPRCDVVFTGSSTIKRWNTLVQDMGSIPSINRGFGGSQIADVNFYFDKVVKPYHPRAIVFYAGDNDINAGKSPYQVLADFKKFMALKSSRLGSTPVFVVSIKPSKLRLAQFAKQVEANMMLREYAAQRGDLYYIDVVDAMLTNGAPKDIFVQDGLHITQKCRNYLQPLIAGEAYPPYRDGLPAYVTLKNVAVRKKLPVFSL